jgi:hypothetical protein
MNTNEEEQIRVYSPATPKRCVGGFVLVLDFIHANDSLVSETAEMGFVGGTRCPLARRSAAKTAQRVGPAAAERIRRRISAPSAISGIVPATSFSFFRAFASVTGVWK